MMRRRNVGSHARPRGGPRPRSRFADRALWASLLCGALLFPAVIPAQAVTAGTVPAPGPDEAVISVRVSGDRLAGQRGNAGPVAGVQLRLSPSATDADAWAGYPWASCVSDAQGDCSFVVPVEDGGGTDADGMASDARPYVHGGSQPAGWHAVSQFSYNWGNTGSYVFRFDQNAVAGQTYRSTDLDPNFMYRTDDPDASLPVARNTSFGQWTVARDNPPMTEVCGLDVAFLVDLSSSIGSAELVQMKAAIDDAVEALSGSPNRVAFFSFDRTSPASRGTNDPTLRSVRTAAEAASAQGVYQGWRTGGGTNWDAGLYAVAAAPEAYDLVLVVTDGEPTVFGTPGNEEAASQPRTRLRDVEASVFSANQVKAQVSRTVGGVDRHTRVVAFGVGLEGNAHLNLPSISGPVEGEDYFRASDYTVVAEQLVALAGRNCQGTVDVHKRVIPSDVDITGMDEAALEAASQPAEGWSFTAVPASGSQATIPSGQGTQTTDADGNATIPVTFADPAVSGRITVTEQQRDGYAVVPVGGRNLSCVDANSGTDVDVTDTGDAENPGGILTAQLGAAIECTMYNRAVPVPAEPVTVSKSIADQESSGLGLGDRVVFPITAEVPRIPADHVFTEFSIVDDMSPRLEDVRIDSVELGGVAVDASYYEQTSADPLKVWFNAAGLAWLTSQRGESVVVTVSGSVKEVGDGDIANTADYRIAHAHGATPPSPGEPADACDPDVEACRITPPVVSHWGDLTLQKADAARTSTTLKGATFEVYASLDPYAADCAATGRGAAPIEFGAETEFASDASGAVSIAGLFVSDSVNTVADAAHRCYWVKETAAPAGYAAPSDPWTAVRVTKGESAAGYDYRILNEKAAGLPVTGAQGQALLIVGGLVLIVLGAVLLVVRRRRTRS